MGQEQSHTEPGHNLSRGGARLKVGTGEALRGEGLPHLPDGHDHPGRVHSLCSPMHCGPGPHGLCRARCPTRTTAHAPLSEVVPLLSFRSCAPRNHRITLTKRARQALSQWTDLQWFRLGVPLGPVLTRIFIRTDASPAGWGAVCEGRPAHGLRAQGESISWNWRPCGCHCWPSRTGCWAATY